MEQSSYSIHHGPNSLVWELRYNGVFIGLYDSHEKATRVQKCPSVFLDSLGKERLALAKAYTRENP